LTSFRAVLKPHAAKLRKSKMPHRFEGLSLWSYAWIGAVLLSAGFVHGLVGLGFPLIAMPLLALALPFKSAILFILLPMLSSTSPSPSGAADCARASAASGTCRSLPSPARGPARAC
jgi:uncharacterized membrane protein YfcA